MSASDVVLVNWLAVPRSEDRIVGPGEFLALFHVRKNSLQRRWYRQISPAAPGFHSDLLTAIPLRADGDREGRQRLAIHGCELLGQINPLPLQSTDLGDVHAGQYGKQHHLPSRT